MKRIMKGFGIAVLLMICLILIALSVLKIYCKLPQKNPSGILMAFDDYYEENWEQYFDLFEKYGAKVTFFINAGLPTDFCYDAIGRGHEIGFHTMGHADMEEATAEEIWTEAIAPIEEFRKRGIELTSFAYPYGAYTEETNQKLLQHYKVVRGGYYYEIVPKENLKTGFVEAKPIDNNKFSSDLQFWWVINKMLYSVRFQEGAVLPVYSHAIESGETCITPKRLEYILKRAKELNLEFYTYKELQ